MQAALLVFDHVRKAMTVVATGPAQKKLAELARSNTQVATSGQPGK
jgi:hypothetical protein